MKNALLLFTVLFTANFYSFAQDVQSRDTISIVGSALGGMRFYQHGQSLNMSNLAEILKPDPQAYSYFKKAKTNNAFSLVFSALGGFAIGWELGTSLGGGGINWAVMGAGIGAVGISIPFAIGTKRNARKAVELFNSRH